MTGATLEVDGTPGTPGTPGGAPGANGGPPDGQFPEEQPLYGWRDDTVQSMRTQLAWARQAGIGFFMFDWFNYFNAKDPINNALANSRALKVCRSSSFSPTPMK